MSKIIGIILLVIAVIVVVYIFRTVPTNNPLSSKPSETAAPQSNVKTSPSTGGGGGGAGTTYQIPPAQPTPVTKRVYIGSAGVSGYPEQYVRISLYSRLKEGETIDITGWKIKTNKTETNIPQAVEIYRPAGFANSNISGDIILKPGNYVDLYNFTSPLNANLRLNKCSGYLQQTYNFQPLYLPQTCPQIPSSEIKNLSGQCQSYIQTLGSCKLPTLDFINSLPGTDEGNACRAYLQTIGYNSCFNSHQNDTDFFSSQWIVWFNNLLTLDSSHDDVRLYDKAGNLVSEYTY